MGHQEITESKQEINSPFQAKSAGVSMIVVLTIGIYFITRLFSILPSDQAVPDGAIGLLITTTILIIVVESVLQIVLFIGAGRIENRTERDDQIAALSTRNAYYLLVVGVFASVGSLFLGFSAFEIISVLLIAFLLAEVVSFASQLVLYQRLS